MPPPTKPRATSEVVTEGVQIHSGDGRTNAHDARGLSRRERRARLPGACPRVCVSRRRSVRHSGQVMSTWTRSLTKSHSSPSVPVTCRTCRLPQSERGTSKAKPAADPTASNVCVRTGAAPARTECSRAPASPSTRATRPPTRRLRRTPRAHRRAHRRSTRSNPADPTLRPLSRVPELQNPPGPVVGCADRRSDASASPISTRGRRWRSPGSSD